MAERSEQDRADSTGESGERFEATFEQAAVGMALVGPDGRWLRVNRKLCALVGYTHDEMMRLTFQDITPTTSPPTSPSWTACSPGRSRPTRWRSGTSARTAR